MSFVGSVLQILDRVAPPRVAHAHCSIPCGLYDTAPSLMAAKTVLTMVQKIQALEVPGLNASKEQRQQHGQDVARMTLVKQEHALLCRREVVDVLWAQFFKPEHLQQAPNLHDLVWGTAKLSTQCSQQVNLQAAEQLVQKVQEIAAIYDKVGGQHPGR